MWNSRNALAKFCNNPTVVLGIGNVTITAQVPPHTPQKKHPTQMPTLHFKSAFSTFNIQVLI